MFDRTLGLTLLAIGILCCAGCGQQSSELHVPTEAEQAAWAEAHPDQVQWMEDWDRRYEEASDANDFEAMRALNLEMTQYLNEHRDE